MKAFLLYKDQNIDLQQGLPLNEQALTQDLELDTLFKAMALGDKFLYEVVSKVVLSCLNNDPNTIIYRQNILKDCLKNPLIIRNMYDIVVEAIEGRKKAWWGFWSKYPNGILHGSIEVMHLYMGMLRKLRNIADEHSDKFESEGFESFFTRLKQELSNEYFESVNDRLMELKFRGGVLISAELGKGNKGANYILRKSEEDKRGWMKRIVSQSPPSYSFYISDRDQSGARALSELNDRGIHLAANALGQSVDHIQNFINILRIELGFYIGCLNLREQLAQKGESISFALPVARNERRHSFRGSYDVCLALHLEQRIVGNDLNADNKNLVIITGANQGGKSTFLRSIGLAQLMMQCGMFVPAESLCSNVCDSLFTHFKREEDATMNSGKLDEELGRMSDIVDHITSNSMVLLNESFAATNEREGSEISRQIICALLEKRIKVFFVTHLYDFAHSFYGRKEENAIFLRAERQADGGRTFKLIEGEPLQTSYGEDLYNRIFGTDNVYPDEEVTLR
jgi:DNA mismatch repair ATPase MutS